MGKSSSEYFKDFNEKKQDVEKIYNPVSRGRKKGVKYGAIYNANYRKRRKVDKKKNLHHKYLKYPRELDRKIKEVMKEKWVEDLDIKSENDMFVVAVEKLIKDNESNEKGEI